MVSSAPVLRKYFVDVVKPAALRAGAGDDCAKAIDVFANCCDVMTLFLNASAGHANPDELETAILEFMRGYFASFGDYNWTLKFHLSMHIPRQWRALVRQFPQAKLPNCFALERKNKSCLYHMRGRFSTISQERGVLEDIFLDQLHDLGRTATDGFLRAHAPSSLEAIDLREELGMAAADDDLEVAAVFRAAAGDLYGKNDIVITKRGWVGKITRLLRRGGYLFPPLHLPHFPPSSTLVHVPPPSALRGQPRIQIDSAEPLATTDHANREKTIERLRSCAPRDLS